MTKKVKKPILKVSEEDFKPAAASFDVGEPFTPTEITPVEIPQKYNRYGNHTTLLSAPKLIIAGKDIELTELKAQEYPSSLRTTFYTADNDDLLVSGHGPAERSTNYPGQSLAREHCKIYKAVVNGTDIFMTTGSYLEIKDTLVKNGCSDPWDLETELCGSESDKNPTVVMIGSTIVASTLNVNGGVLLNNSRVETKTAYLQNSTIVATRLLSEETVDLDSTNIKYSTITGTKWLRSNKSELINVDLSGIPHITLERVTSAGDGTFRLSTWSTKGRLSLRISDTMLTDFSMFFNTEALEGLKDENGIDNTITIARRVDYGYFSGIKHVPFVRVNKFDIIVDSTVFSGKELNPHSFPKEPAKEDEIISAPPYAYPNNPSYRPVGFSINGSRMDDTWTKARKIISSQAAGHNYSARQNPLGSLGEGLVDTLVDQIRSRSKLYVELFSFVR